MRGVLGALIGVPGTMLVAGGLGLVGVTLWTRIFRGSRPEPIRWSHLALGTTLFVAGVLVLWLEVAVIGAA